MSSPVRKKWIVPRCDEARAAEFAVQLGVSPLIAGLLLSRGINEEHAARKLLGPSADQLHDPSLMLGMDRAVRRILQAVDQGETILIYGDYDVDGTTGTIILRRALQLLGARTEFHVPHRFTEGYGIRQDVLERSQAAGCTLVVSVDCGIRAHAPLAWAADHNLDCIVTDHHLPDKDEGVPRAHAVLNPNQAGCSYPDKGLAGVGVAFKLVHALLRERGREELVDGFLKVVALGTVADVAPLVGENRAIVALGLADLPHATNLGLLALMQIAGCAADGGTAVRAYDLGFRLGPRINAAGRMDEARTVIRLFEATEAAEATALAETLDRRNRERQTMQREITKLALAEIEACGGDAQCVAVVAGEDWHRGVIGLAASRISEQLNRPCIVVSLEGDVGHASARSIASYHLLDALTTCADLFERFGGHACAAGMVIRRENIPELRRRLNEHAAQTLSEADFVPQLQVDAELELDAVTLKLAEELGALEPFGAGWSNPIFATRRLRLIGEPRILKDRHLKVRLADSSGHTRELLWWSGVEKASIEVLQTGALVDVAYSVEANSWRGTTRVQMIAHDVIVDS